MTLKQYLLLMALGTGLCWLAWGFVIWNIDPKTAGLFGFVYFYIAFFLALLGTFSVIGFMIRRKILKNDDLVLRHVKRTFRQGFEVASAATIILLLLQNDLLTWWNGALVIVFFFIVEGIIFTNRRYSNEDYVREDIREV